MSDAPKTHPDAPRGDAVRLYVLRHGEPVRRDLFYGHFDIALSQLGRTQAQAQGEALASSAIAAVYSSDLRRAVFGAEAVARHHGLAVVHTPLLREMHLGALEDVPYAEGLARHPELAGRSYNDMLDFAMPDGGESVRDVAQRVIPFVESIAVRHANGERPGVVVYAHNTVTRVVLGQAAGLGAAGYVAFAQRYGAINRVDLPVVDGAVVWPRAAIAYANRDVRWGGRS